MKFKALVPEVTAFLFILLWVYAALSKLLDYQTFKVQLGQSPLMSPIAGFTAWFIPVIEIVIALLLASSLWKLLGLYASFSLMILFTSYIIAITKFSSYIPCSCGGILQNMGWTQHLIFNISFSVLALVSILFYPKDISLQQIRTSRKPVTE